MIRSQQITLLVFRLMLGFMMFYAGMSKILDPSWSPFGYLARAKTFPEFYALFLDPAVISYTTLLNEWGLTLVGLALMLGIGTRIASVCGILFMMLYYFPVLAFPYIGEHSFIIDEHLIYAAGFALLITFRAGMVWSVAEVLLRQPLVRRFSILQKLII